MKKTLCMILAFCMCAAILVGCGPNTNTPAGSTPSGSQNAEGTSTQGTNGETPPEPASEGIKITENCTFNDPADLDFDARYVVYLGPENPMIVMSAKDGLVAQYIIIYAKEEKALCSYTLYVCDTAESAKAYAEAMVANGMTLTPLEGDAAVMSAYTDEMSLEIVIGSLNGAGLIPDTKASSFANFQVEMNGATLLE